MALPLAHINTVPKYKYKNKKQKYLTTEHSCKLVAAKIMTRTEQRRILLQD